MLKEEKCDPFKEIFDITHINGKWLCNEDGIFYYTQKESQEHVGYMTGILDNKKNPPFKETSREVKYCEGEP